ncbi:tryptophan synthase subunit beta [Candidatus Vidania fulgoroideae]|nr:tryptophan synthase subunit beta [Candidatus Vidania fulgoroideae]
MFISNKDFFGIYGGQYVSNIILDELNIIKKKYKSLILKKNFLNKLYSILCKISNRPTPLYKAKNFSKKFGNNFFFKREDLNFTGSHKINNVIGQILIAKKLGKKTVIAETGAGQHGVAVASSCALMNIKCKIFMGEKDFKKQKLNVIKMKKMGAKIVKIKEGNGTLKEAINSAIRYWAKKFSQCFYVIGSVIGPSPYPEMVRNFQSIIGKETKIQALKSNIKIDNIISCIGGGSNSLGMFFDFLNQNINLFGIEAGGNGKKKNSCSIKYGKVSVLHGCKTLVITKKNGIVKNAHSISSGLRYPAIGPEHAYLKDKKLVKYRNIKDKYVIKAFNLFCKLEGIIPSFESSHAIAFAIKISNKEKKKNTIITLSGRGEKDL